MRIERKKNGMKCLGSEYTKSQEFLFLLCYEPAHGAQETYATHA